MWRNGTAIGFRAQSKPIRPTASSDGSVRLGRRQQAQWRLSWGESCWANPLPQVKEVRRQCLGSRGAGMSWAMRVRAVVQLPAMSRIARSPHGDHFGWQTSCQLQPPFRSSFDSPPSIAVTRRKPSRFAPQVSTNTERSRYLLPRSQDVSGQKGAGVAGCPVQRHPFSTTDDARHTADRRHRAASFPGPGPGDCQAGRVCPRHKARRAFLRCRVRRCRSARPPSARHRRGSGSKSVPAIEAVV